MFRMYSTVPPRVPETADSRFGAVSAIKAKIIDFVVWIGSSDVSIRSR